MINDIIRYIEHLKSEYDLNVFIHSTDRSLNELTDFAVPYNIHLNPYCLFVKSNYDMWRECIKSQREIPDTIKVECSLKCCFAGVSEYIYPIRNNDEYIGFLSITGYVGNEKTYIDFSKKSGFSLDTVKKFAQTNLKKEIPSEEYVSTLVKPLVAMITLLSANSPKKSITHGMNLVFGSAVIYIHANYADKIKVKDIADACFVSESYMNRIFKKHSGKSIMQYVNDYRIEKAKQLLKNTNIPIGIIGFSIGFYDSNYFISVFGKNVGMSPGKYRKQCIDNHDDKN